MTQRTQRTSADLKTGIAGVNVIDVLKARRWVLDKVGAPVLTEQGRNELTATWRYITSPAYALFSSVRSEEFARVSHAAETAMIGVWYFKEPATALKLASIGLIVIGVIGVHTSSRVAA